MEDLVKPKESWVLSFFKLGMHHLAICQQLSILVHASLWSGATVFMDFSVVRHLFGAGRRQTAE